VNPREPLAWNGEQAKGIVVAQVLLHREREAAQILERAQMLRTNTRGIEAAAVMRHVFVRMPQRPLHALELQGPKLVDARGLDGLVNLACRRTGRHGAH
jgi:hypothetical protein